jgi:hypothetical protein
MTDTDAAACYVPEPGDTDADRLAWAMKEIDRLRAANGLRALHYVQDEIRQLSSISLTSEGKHALLCWRIMLRDVWGKEFRDGEFVFLEPQP